MVSNVALISKSIDIVAFSTLSAQLEGLQQKKFNLELQKLERAGNSAMEQLIDRRIVEIDASIAEIKQAIDGHNVQPRQISYPEDGTSPQQGSTTSQLECTTPQQECTTPQQSENTPL